jgi:hypothetical protein
MQGSAMTNNNNNATQGEHSEDANYSSQCAPQDNDVIDPYILKFPSLKKKAKLPHQYMYVDAALNALGTARFPDEWGKGKAWLEHPFLYTGKKRIRRVSHKKDRVQYKLNNSYSYSQLPTDELEQASSIYKKVRDELLDVLERGTVKGFWIMHRDKIEPIDKDHHLTWRKRCVQIFYTGKVAYRSEIYTILIDAVGLSKLIGDKTLPIKINSAKIRILQKISEEINTFPNEHNVKISKEKLLDILVNTFKKFGFKISGYYLVKEIWDRLDAHVKKNPGRCSASYNSLWQEKAPLLSNLIQTACARDQVAIILSKDRSRETINKSP